MLHVYVTAMQFIIGQSETKSRRTNNILINLWTHTVDFRLTYFVCAYFFHRIFNGQRIKYGFQ